MEWFRSSAVAHGAISGLLAAALVDISAFRNWKNVHDAMTYDWGIAAWRWFQGAVMGGLTAAGIGAL